MSEPVPEDFVLDASVTLAWCFGDEATRASRNLLERLAAGATAWVPSLWGLEIANILTMAERTGRLKASDTEEFLALIEALDVRSVDTPPKRALAEIRPLARREELSSYDAAYLDLALRQGLALASRDRDLLKAARRNGVAVLVV